MYMSALLSQNKTHKTSPSMYVSYVLFFMYICVFICIHMYVSMTYTCMSAFLSQNKAHRTSIRVSFLFIRRISMYAYLCMHPPCIRRIIRYVYLFMHPCQHCFSTGRYARRTLSSYICYILCILCFVALHIA
jgi:hypothetical protein